MDGSLELKLLGTACTDKSLSFENPDDPDGEPVWLPRSQVKNLEDIIENQLDDAIGWTTEAQVEVHLPFWLIESKGLDGHAEEL